MRTETVSFAASLNLNSRPDAELLLLKPSSQWDVKVIKFASRKALEAFNVRAKLAPVVYSQVPVNCVINRHESDGAARLAAGMAPSVIRR